MIDFKDKGIYERENRKLQDFLTNKMVTLTEQDSLVELDDSSNGVDVIDTASFMGGDPIDFGGEGNDVWDEASVTGSGRKRELDLSNDRSYEQDTWWKNFLYAPFFLMLYVSKQVVYEFPDKEDWKSILQSLNKITIFSAVTGAIMWVSDFVFLISGPFQTITSLLMFFTSFFILKYVYEGESKGSVNFEEDFDFTGTPFEESNDDEALGFGGLNLTLDEDDGLNLTVDGGEDQYVDAEVGDVSERLAESPIDVSKNQFFDRGLLDVYANNAKYEGVEITNRKELLESFSGYIVTNDKNYGQWRIIRERSIEYNNIVYSLFKGLGQMVNQFLTDEEKIVVMDMRSNPLLFKIEVELPSYFKERAVKSSLYEIENILKENEDDTDVSVTCSYYRGVFVFKFLRLDNRNLISLGDILRFYDETKKKTALDIFADEKKGLPVLLGLRENEYPYVLDLEENTSGTIVGGSNSGKSWLTFLLMFNLVLSNDYNNVQFIVMDKKNAPFWNQFAKFPHVLGYHTNHETYLDLLREIYEEVDRRKTLMNELGAEDVKGLRERLRREKDYEGLKEVPLLTIVIDEITSTMQDLKVHYDDAVELYNEIRGILGKITQEGRSVGVRLILIGQRSIDASIPKNSMMNSTFKLGMRMENDSEFEFMFGKEVNRIVKPKGKGMGLARTAEEPGIYMVKTLTLGGTNNDQILKMIRVLALEWVRRSKGLDDIINQPNKVNFELSYNRDKYVKESLQEIEEGRILSHREINHGYGERDVFRGRTFEVEEDIEEEGEDMNGYEIEKHTETDTVKNSNYWVNEEVRVDRENELEGSDRESRVVDETSISNKFNIQEEEKKSDIPKEITEKEQSILDRWKQKLNGDIDKMKSKELESQDSGIEGDEVDREWGMKDEDVEKEDNVNYVEDDDEDIFGDWVLEETIAVDEVKKGTSESGEFKLHDNEELTLENIIGNVAGSEGSDNKINEERDSDGAEINDGLSLEEMMKAEGISTDSKSTQTDGELSRQLGEINTKSDKKYGDDTDIWDNERDHIEIKSTQTDKKEQWVKDGTVERTGDRFTRNEPKRVENIGDYDKKDSRNVEKQINQKEEISRNRKLQETQKSGIVNVSHILSGGMVDDSVTRKSIKQYVIENGEREGLLNRKIRCDELEQVYPQSKIDQALDMIVIIQEGDWYVVKI